MRQTFKSTRCWNGTVIEVHKTEDRDMGVKEEAGDGGGHHMMEKDEAAGEAHKGGFVEGSRKSQPKISAAGTNRLWEDGGGALGSAADLPGKITRPLKTNGRSRGNR